MVTVRDVLITLLTYIVTVYVFCTFLEWKVFNQDVALLEVIKHQIEFIQGLIL